MGDFKVIKGKLYPNKKQRIFFNKCFGSKRFVYNALLDSYEDSYNQNNKELKTTPAKLKKDFPWLRDVDSLALANAEINIKEAFKRFFDGVSQYPTHKKKKDSKDSYTTNNQRMKNKKGGYNETIQVVINKITTEEAKNRNMLYDNPTSDSSCTSKDLVKLPKVSWVRAHINKEPPEGYVLKKATISKDSVGEYHISILYENKNENNENNEKEMTESNTCGLDYKMDTLFMCSDGRDGSYPKYYRIMENKLKKEQKKLSRMTYKSKNYEKQRKKLAKIHRKIANQREDYLQKVSTQIANEYDYVVVEDLNMQALSRSLHFAKSVYDTGFGMFRDFLDYKLKRKGGRLIKADKWYPSTQTCSKCGYKHTELKGIDNLKVKEWVCPECGTIHNRDKNAAINLKLWALDMYKASDSSFLFLEAN